MLRKMAEILTEQSRSFFDDEETILRIEMVTLTQVTNFTNLVKWKINKFNILH